MFNGNNQALCASTGSVDTLGLEILRFQTEALASSTLDSYLVGLRSYNLFCTHTGSYLFPLEEHVLQRYVASLAQRVSYSTIKVYLCGLQFFSHMRGLTESISSMPRVYYLLRGIRRSQGSTFQRPRRQPITTNHLKLIHHRLTFMNYNKLQQVSLSTAASLAFFGFLRCSEYTCASSSCFDPSKELMVRNITIAADYSILTVHIRASKTDPFRNGCYIRIGATGDKLCPVTWMREYLAIHPVPQGPLFVLSSTHFVTRRDIVTMLSRCLPEVGNINTHSFRIGGASAAATAGVPDSTIQLLGRWSSDAYRRYLRLSNITVIDLSRRISRVNVISRFWSQDSFSSAQHVG